MKKAGPGWGTTPTFQPGMLGLFAQSRRICDGDWPTAVLLMRLGYRWRQKRKLQRLGREWIAESAAHWARGAGLSKSEMKNRALPGIKKVPAVTVAHMKLRATDKAKLIWMSLDQPAWEQHLAEIYSTDGFAAFDEIPLLISATKPLILQDDFQED